MRGLSPPLRIGRGRPGPGGTRAGPGPVTGGPIGGLLSRRRRSHWRRGTVAGGAITDGLPSPQQLPWLATAALALARLGRRRVRPVRGTGPTGSVIGRTTTAGGQLNSLGRPNQAPRCGAETAAIGVAGAPEPRTPDMQGHPPPIGLIGHCMATRPCWLLSRPDSPRAQ